MKDIFSPDPDLVPGKRYHLSLLPAGDRFRARNGLPDVFLGLFEFVGKVRGVKVEHFYFCKPRLRPVSFSDRQMADLVVKEAKG